MSITVTLLVAHFILGTRFDMGSRSGIMLLIVHYVIPIMTISDWLLFDKKGYITKLSPLIWTILPLAYFVYAVIAAQFGDGIGYNSRYPYPFMDADLLGWGRVIITTVILVAFFVVLGYLSFALERLILKLVKKSPVLREGTCPSRLFPTLFSIPLKIYESKAQIMKKLRRLSPH
jgi:hypothetical protein